ncbi:MAG: 1,2-phenylacetyl-CoA epoxidase subunit PaaC [Meiothermus sp.]|nr:1,2-phenylacetyl-CoA epoxidase subunit PaaC [Meiothermus sp.]
MNTELKEALIAKLTALADDELILSHRLAGWTGHAPLLEEDIALANMAQDELGHATVWLELRRALDGSDPDRLAFFRDASEFRNCELLELPKGDWAFTMLRQYLFDVYEGLWLQAAQVSSYPPLAEAAAKVVREERFHIQHTQTWVERLGLGTKESHQRAQEALTVLWPYAQQLFAPEAGEDRLVAEGVVPDLEAIRERWLEITGRHLRASGLEPPPLDAYVPRSRQRHTEHLWSLLAEMQSVARWDAEARTW